jgi:hypothetical protein
MARTNRTRDSMLLGPRGGPRQSRFKQRPVRTGANVVVIRLLIDTAMTLAILSRV